MKKKISGMRVSSLRTRSQLSDLDVVTVAFWDKGKNGNLGRGLVLRIKQKELDMITPFYLLEHLTKWRHITLKEQIEDFYIKNSSKLLTNEDVDTKIDELGIDDIRVLLELQSKGIKEDDAFIVLVTSIFDADYLVTFNRKHLRNKEKEINEVLKKNELRTIRIVGPEEA